MIFQKLRSCDRLSVLTLLFRTSQTLQDLILRSHRDLRNQNRTAESTLRIQRSIFQEKYLRLASIAENTIIQKLSKDLMSITSFLILLIEKYSCRRYYF